MPWSRKILVTTIIFSLGLVAGVVFIRVSDPFQRVVIPLICAMAALWIFDVYFERAIRALFRKQTKK